MPTTYTYTYADAYLAPLISKSLETRAVADVADLGTLPASWVQRLVVLRAYVITCLECNKAPDDTFAAKLSAYRKEYADQLARARAAQDAVNATAGTGSPSSSPFTVSLERS